MGKRKGKYLVYQVNVQREVTFSSNIHVAIPADTPEGEVDEAIEQAVQRLDRDGEVANSYEFDDTEHGDVEVRDFDKHGTTWTLDGSDYTATEDNTGDEEYINVVGE